MFPENQLATYIVGSSLSIVEQYVDFKRSYIKFSSFGKNYDNDWIINQMISNQINIDILR